MDRPPVPEKEKQRWWVQAKSSIMEKGGEVKEYGGDHEQEIQSMKIFFAGSETMQIPNIPISLGKMGHEVLLYEKSMEYVEEHEEEYDKFKQFLQINRPDLVISTVFFQIAAAYTHQLEIKYAVYGMDSPHYAAWVPKYPRLENVYLFHFDTREIRRFREADYSNVYYLPLAAGVTWADRIHASAAERKQLGSDVSFVGGLYSENPFDRYGDKLMQSVQEQIWDIIESSAFIWDGQERLQTGVGRELVEYCREAAPELCNSGLLMGDEYYFRQWTIARKLSNVERTLLFEQAAEAFDFRLYTREKEIVPEQIHRYPPVNAMTEQLKVFQSSAINLNLTLRSIESGIPLRVFDILSVGGFVLTDYRVDAEDIFREDEEIVMFRSPEEMLDKAAYYLKHPNERERIAQKGYRAAKERCSYERMLAELLQTIFHKP